MAERDEGGRFTSGGTEALPLDDPRVDMATFKAARADGKESVALEELEKPASPTGEEKNMKEFKSIRDEQQGHGNSKGGAQKKIDRLVKERETLKERLRQYEPDFQPGAVESKWAAEVARRKEAANGNGAAPQETREESSLAERTESPTEDPRLTEIRQIHPNYDEEMSRAAKENLRIDDEAAKVMHGLPNGLDIAHFLVTNNELRAELNKLTPAQQIQEIQKMNEEFSHTKSGVLPFSQRIKSTFNKEEVAEMHATLKQNPISTRVVASLVREMNSLPNGVQVFKALVAAPQTCQQLATMSQADAAEELKRISARLEGSSRVAPITTRAPAPIKPVGNNGSTASTVPLDKMNSMAEYRKARAAGRTR
ncbi:MAG TPA: hypothetical protein VOA78_15340 [Candidatus Dormibacteraeota bacterium]|nr:hypothetical protein [Candidatus Dormibacteraeota bacterium]